MPLIRWRRHILEVYAMILAILRYAALPHTLRHIIFRHCHILAMLMPHMFAAITLSPPDTIRHYDMMPLLRRYADVCYAYAPHYAYADDRMMLILHTLLYDDYYY